MDDLVKIVMKKGKEKKVFLTDLKEFLMEKNRRIADKLLSKGKNPVIYVVKSLLQDEISYDITILNPGKIGSEYYETKGHQHVKRTSEVYSLIKGKGEIIAKNFSNGKKKIIKLKEGKLMYVPEGYGHRTRNTGKEKLMFITVSQADSGHDYEVSKKRGFD